MPSARFWLGHESWNISRLGYGSIFKNNKVIGKLLNKAYEVADKLANGSQSAIRWTKYSLNNWLRQAGPAFDTSLALEFMGFAGPDVREGVASLKAKRPADFG